MTHVSRGCVKPTSPNLAGTCRALARILFQPRRQVATSGAESRMGGRGHMASAEARAYNEGPGHNPLWGFRGRTGVAPEAETF